MQSSRRRASVLSQHCFVCQTVAVIRGCSTMNEHHRPLAEHCALLWVHLPDSQALDHTQHLKWFPVLESYFLFSFLLQNNLFFFVCLCCLPSLWQKRLEKKTWQPSNRLLHPARSRWSLCGCLTRVEPNILLTPCPLSLLCSFLHHSCNLNLSSSCLVGRLFVSGFCLVVIFGTFYAKPLSSFCQAPHTFP